MVRVLDFDGNDIRLSYDGIDNLTEYRDNVQHVEYGYSGMWKLTRRRDHRGVVNFRYDREERLRRVTNERLQSYEFAPRRCGQRHRRERLRRGRPSLPA